MAGFRRESPSGRGRCSTVVLVLGTPRFLLPRNAERVALSPALLGDSLFFHVRQPLPVFRTMFRLPENLRSTVVSYEAFDHILKEVLKTPNARRYEVPAPMDFREALAEMIAAMETNGRADSMTRSATARPQPPL